MLTYIVLTALLSKSSIPVLVLLFIITADVAIVGIISGTIIKVLEKSTDK